MTRLHGHVQRIYPERGFGFIRVPGGEDYFFHSTGLEGCHIGELEEGVAVAFEWRTTPKGKRAERIARVA